MGERTSGMRVGGREVSFLRADSRYASKSNCAGAEEGTEDDDDEKKAWLKIV